MEKIGLGLDSGNPQDSFMYTAPDQRLPGTLTLNVHGIILIYTA